MDFFNTYNLQKHIDTINDWLSVKFSDQKNKTRFSRYKFYFKELYIEKEFSTYYHFLKRYNDLQALRNDCLKAFDLNKEIEKRLYEDMKTLFDNLDLSFKQSNGAMYCMYCIQYRSNFTMYYESSLSNNIKFMITKFLNDSLTFSKYYFPNKDAIIKESFEFVEKFNEIANQCFDISVVHHLFKDEESKDFIDVLENVIEGSDIVGYDRNANERNFLFELSINGYFKLCGWDITFDKIADGIAKKDDITMYIECKKVTSEKKFLDRIKEALEQLKTTHTEISNPKSYGVVFINVTNLVYKKLNNYTFKDDNEAKNHIDDTVRELILSYEKKINSLNDNFLEYSLGSCFFFQGFIPINNSKIALATTFRFITSEKLDDEKYAFFKKEMTPFKNVVSDISTELNKIFSS